MNNRVFKYAKFLSVLSILGMTDEADKLAQNNGLKMLAQANGMSAKNLTEDLKNALEKELTKSEQKYKKGLFKRVDHSKLSDDEKHQAAAPQKMFSKERAMPEGGMANLPFMKETVPTIHR